MATLAAFDFLAGGVPKDVPGVCVLFGDEPFLKREGLATLRRLVLAGADAEFSLTTLDGRTAELADVLDELATVSLFGGGRRLVVIDDADDFVTRHRAALEDYAARPSHTGVLVLVVRTWASTTRLAKAVAATGLPVECKAPPPARLATWLATWARTRHGAKLERGAAELLVEIVGPELGLIDQELAKLTAAAGQGAIEPPLVRELVGGWRARTAWEMLDAAAAGDAAVALVQLDRLILAGENPIGLLAQISSSLRRFAAATRLIERAEAAGRRTSLRQSLQTAGVPPFVLDKAERQLRQLGRERAGRLYRWLLECDLALKGAGSSPPRARLVLEQLIARLSTAGKVEAAARV